MHENPQHDREPPPGERQSLIGIRHNWGGTEPFGLSRADRRHHLYAVGKTGSGKTTLLRNLILQDIYAGEGVGVIDPHGDLAEELMDLIPSWRSDDVAYFNPQDLEWPIAFNLLKWKDKETRHLVASGIVSAFRSIWKDSWGPRLEYILYCSAAALLDVDNASLLGLQRILIDERYRHWVLKQCQDPLVRSFWFDEFESYDKRFMREAIAPVQNKIGQLLASPPLRNILGQVKSKIDLRFMMDRKRIFIANLAKGQLGVDKANLLGAVLVSQFQLAAMGRSTVPEEERQDFYLYIDEFHNFSTESFAALLSESRKYRLCLTLSHQYTSQVAPDVRDAVFGNAGTIISFRVGEMDSLVLEREFGSRFSAEQFTQLDNFQVHVKLIQDGVQLEPFPGSTFAPLEVRGGRKRKLIARSREKYATRREIVEERILRWVERKIYAGRG